MADGARKSLSQFGFLGCKATRRGAPCVPKAAARILRRGRTNPREMAPDSSETSVCDEMVAVDQWYVNIHHSPVSVWDAAAPFAVQVRSIRPEESVLGRCRFRLDDRAMLELDDGVVALSNGDGYRYLTEASVFEQHFVSVHPGIVHVHRCLPPLAPYVVGQIRRGKIVEAVLTCCSRGGNLRMKLKDGTWTTLINVAGATLFREVTLVDQWFLHVHVDPLPVTMDMDALGKSVRHVGQGQLVHGNGIACNVHGASRLLLDDGAWVTMRDPDGVQTLCDSALFEHTVFQI